MLNLVIHKVTTWLLKGNLSERKLFVWLASCVQRVWMQNWRNLRARPASQHSYTLRVSLSCRSLSSWFRFHLLRSRVLWTGSVDCRVPARRHMSVPGRPITQVRNLLGGSYFRVDRKHCLFSWNISTVAPRIFFQYICLMMTFSCTLWSDGALNVNEKIVSLNFHAWILCVLWSMK